MRQKRMLMFAAVVLLALSCSAMEDSAPFSPGAEKESMGMLADKAEEAGSNVRAEWTPMGGERPEVLRIVTTTVEMEVESFEESMARIKKISSKSKGHIASSSSRRDEEGLLSGSVEVKVPAERYEAMLGEITGLGDVRDMQETSEDVTEEYVDLEARLENKQRLEKRILELLEAGTGTIDDILHVEKELSGVREDIERIEGRLRYLDSRTRMSTITVNLYEKGARYGGEPTAGDVFHEIVDKTGIVFMGSLGILITFVVAVTPWIAAAVLIVLVILVVVRLRKKPSKSSAGSAT